MKQAKKLLALVMVLAMVMSLGITAFAAEGDTTITFPDNDKHVYEIYQVFTGELQTPEGESKEVMVNIKYGVNTANPDTEVEEDVLKNLVAEGADVKALVESIVDYSTDPVATKSAEQNSVTVPSVGYYVVKDMGLDGTGTATEGKPLSEFIVDVVGPLTIQPKRSGEPTSEKKVKDINDSQTTSYTEWQDSADHDIGDTIPFQIKLTVPAGIESYTGGYKMYVHDTESEGLTFNKNIEVYLNNSEEALSTNFYDVVTEGIDETFQVKFDDVNQFAKEGDVIYIRYTSTLNEKAVIGNPGNPNTMELEFSNKNDKGEEGTKKGEPDTVIVFTYKTIINKVKEDEKTPLDGATFELSKKVAKEDGSFDWKPILIWANESDDHTFTFKGLDDGDYRLKETEAPAGYNPIKDVFFTITAVHTEDNGDPALKLTSLNGGVTADTESGEIELATGATEDGLNGELSANVVNKKGVELPSTGGIGTTIFYVVGSVLMLAAAVLLITRKKMSAYQD